MSLASCNSGEEQMMPADMPMPSSFTPGSRLEWRVVTADDGSKFNALLSPRFYDKQRKEPCDFAFANYSEQSRNVYRCLPVFDKFSDGNLTGYFADENCLLPVFIFYPKKLGTATVADYPFKYQKAELQIGSTARNNMFYTDYYELDASAEIKNFYQYKDKCESIQNPDPNRYMGAKYYEGRPIDANDFVLFSTK